MGKKRKKRPSSATSRMHRLLFLFIPSCLFFCSCVTPGSITKDQESPDRISNIEVMLANTAQTAEELKLEQEKIKGQIEKVEHVLNTRINELNKRLDQLEGIEPAGTTATTVPATTTVPTTTTVPVATVPTVNDTEAERSGVDAPDVTGAPVVAVPANVDVAVAAPVTPEPDIKKMNIEKRYQMGRKSHEEKKHQDAEKYYLSVVGAPSKWFDEKARFFLGSLYYEMGKYNEAIVTLQDLVDKYPNSKNVSNAMLIQGESFSALKQDKNAAIFYQDLITRFPKSKEAEKARSKLKKL
jgi:TolA-binding protein